MRRIMTLLALLAALAVGLGGCALRGQETEAAGEISLPEPTEEPENMILGESLSNVYNEVTLYFAAADGSGFSTVNRSIRTEAGQSLPEAAAAALLESLAREGGRAIGDTRLLSCEYACGTVTVDLSIDARNAQSAQDLLALQTSIGNTLLDVAGVRGVNVLVGGLSEGYCQLPYGAQQARADSVTATYAQLQAERDRLGQEGASPIARSALLYFPTNRGDWLVPELRELSVEDGGFVTALIDALKAGPRQEACAIASIPEGVELLEEAPAIETLSTGERVLSLNFSSTLANYLAFSGLEVWELAGSITLTMCSFLPDLNAVRIMVNGDPITMCDMGDRLARFPGGLMRRDDFSGRVGSTATLYLVSEDGALRPEQRAVSTRSALSPRSLLTELFRYAAPEGQWPRIPLPGGVYPEDLLGVQVFSGIARVNLSGSFYRACQPLSAQDERDLVYSMVNTLCAMQNIRAVRFYVEGRAADTLAGAIYLKSPLMPNPGIVAEEETE